MKTYLISLGYGILQSVVHGYTTRTTPNTTDWKKVSEKNSKSMNAVLYRLLEYEFVKVMHCNSAKEI